MAHPARRFHLIFLALLALAACTQPFPSPAGATAAQLPVGACLDTTGPNETTVAVPCVRPHRWELFARIPYPAEEGDAYPGLPWLELYARDLCEPYFRAYTGPENARAGLGINTNYPTAGDWAGGHRDILCKLYQTSGGSPMWERRVGSRASKSGPATPAAPSHPSATAADPQVALPGNWMPTPGASGPRLLLRFEPEGWLSSAYYGGPAGPSGNYQWVGDNALRLTFASWLQAGEDDFCAVAPAFLREFCQTRTIDCLTEPEVPPCPPQELAGAQGYPSMLSTPALAAPQAYAGPPYPPPPLAPIVVGEIDVTFAVTLDGDTLFFSHETGSRQSFQRFDP